MQQAQNATQPASESPSLADNHRTPHKTAQPKRPTYPIFARNSVLSTFPYAFLGRLGSQR